MKISPLLLWASLAALAALPSCEGVPGAYSGESSSGYDDGSGYSSYSSRPLYTGSAGGYYQSGGYSRPYYPGSSYYGGPSHYRSSHYYSGRDRYDDHDHGHDHYSNHGDYRGPTRWNRGEDYRPSSNSNNRSSSEAIRLVKVRDGTGGDVPQGYHSKEWYKDRGISLSKNVYETRDGDRRGYSGSQSSPKSKSDNSKRKR